MNRLKEIREGKGLSQLDLTRKTGIASTNISNLEKGRVYPWPGWRKRLASALEVSEETIFYGEVEKNGNHGR